MKGAKQIIEIWKGIKYNKQDLSWRFECSNFGRIRNTKTHRIYKEGICGIGYYQICTSVNGKNKNIKIHKAVAETFILNPNNLPFVNHIDGNKLNNNVENLEWVTRQMNTIHAIKMGLFNPSFKLWCESDEKNYTFLGEQNGMAKLSNEDVLFIRKNYIPKGKGKLCNRKELALKFNVSPQLIYKIYKKEIWKHIV